MKLQKPFLNTQKANHQTANIFQQAMIQMEEEEQLLVVEHPRTPIRKPKKD